MRNRDYTKRAADVVRATGPSALSLRPRATM